MPTRATTAGRPRPYETHQARGPSSRSSSSRGRAGASRPRSSRPTFTYGPGDPHKLALFRAILRGRYAFIGDGESVNHPVLHRRPGGGILLAGRGPPGEVYIIGGEATGDQARAGAHHRRPSGVKRPGMRDPALDSPGLCRPAGTLGGRTLRLRADPDPLARDDDGRQLRLLDRQGPGRNWATSREPACAKASPRP